jgi:hypothetical protein
MERQGVEDTEAGRREEEAGGKVSWAGSKAKMRREMSNGDQGEKGIGRERGG